MDKLQELLKYIGAATTIYLTYQATRFISLYLRPSQLTRYHHGKPGTTWALVTGASDGIGYGFASVLCSQNFNVLLHGRNEKKLINVRSSLATQHPNIQIRYVIADASETSSQGEETLLSAAQNLPGKLVILINNVGGSPYEPTYGALSDLPPGNVDKLVNLNARFPTQVTRALLPLLSTNGPSLIMNIGSAAGQLGLPFLTVYSACKSFNKTFTEALKMEVDATGVDVEVLGILVGAVLSGSNKQAVAGFTCNAREMAVYALDRVGCGRGVVWGWWRHALQGLFLTVAPAWVIEPFMTKLMKEMKEKYEREL